MVGTLSSTLCEVRRNHHSKLLEVCYSRRANVTLEKCSSAIPPAMTTEKRIPSKYLHLHITDDKPQSVIILYDVLCGGHIESIANGRERCQVLFYIPFINIRAKAFDKTFLIFLSFFSCAEDPIYLIPDIISVKHSYIYLNQLIGFHIIIVSVPSVVVKY